MAVSNFVPTIWSARLKSNLDKALVLAGRITNSNWQGDAQSGTVHIHAVGDIPVSSHSKGTSVTYAEPYSLRQTLTLNQRKIAGFKTDDLDTIQANIGLVEQYSTRMAYSMSDDIDRYVASLYTGAAAGDVAIDVTSVAASEVRDAFAAMGRILDSNNVPSTGRWAAVSPIAKEAMFKDTNLTQATPGGDAMLASGSIGRFMGFDIFMSNNISGTGVTVTTTAAAAQGATTLAVSSLSAAVPAGTILTFGPGKYARVTANAAASATSITVAALTVGIASGDVATYIKVRKCMFGTTEAITFAQNQYPSVEALRDVSTTDDYIRAQQNYGALVVHPYALGTLSVTEAS